MKRKSLILFVIAAMIFSYFPPPPASAATYAWDTYHTESYQTGGGYYQSYQYCTQYTQPPGGGTATCTAYATGQQWVSPTYSSREVYDGRVTAQSRNAYPDNGYSGSTRYVYYGILNSNPVIQITQTNQLGSAGNVSITGTVSDPDNDNVVVSATINGVEKNVTVTGTASTKTWSLTWSGSQLAEGAYTNIVVKATDPNGGVSTANYTGQILIDKTAPTIPSVSLSETAWTKAPVTVTITPGTDKAGGSGVKGTQYRINNGSWGNWQDYNGSPFQIDQEGHTTIETATTDKANNTGATASAVVKIDRTGPSKPGITVTPSGDWTKETVSIVLTPGVDTGVGTEKTQYKLNNGSWEDYKGTIVLQDEGVHELTAVSIDKLGNVGTELHQTISIDKTLPSRPDVYLSNDSWTNTNVTLVASDGADADSGPDYTEFTRDGQTWTKYIAPVVIQDSGEWTYQVRTVDKAGNIGESSQVIAKVDKEAPGTPELNLTSDKPTQDPVEITLIDGQDDLSGVANSQVKVGRGNWEPYIGPVQVDIEGITDVWGRTIDNAGNVSAEAHAQVFIDRTAPTAPIHTVSDTSWSNQDVSFELGGSQDATDVTYEYKIGNGSYLSGDRGTLTDSGEFIITARAVDAVGLTSPEIKFTIQIDKELPEVVLGPNGLNWSTQGTDVQITATDRLSGVADPIYYEVSQNATPSGSWQTLPSNGQVSVDDGEGTWFVHTQVTDHAGNVGTHTSNPYQLQDVPDVPTLDATALSASEVRLQWNLPSNRYTDGYTYTVKNLNTGKETTLEYPASEYIDQHLVGGENYAYQLTVNNHVGSAEARTEVLTNPDSPLVNINPIYRTPGEMNVTIDPVQSATEYRLVLTDNQGQTRQDTVISDTQHTLTGLNPGSLYTLQVQAINATGASVATSTGFLTLPSTPMGFTSVEIKENSITTQWQSVTTATYYDLYQGDTLVFNGGDQDLSYEDTGLESGTAYTYTIAAGNETGEGEVSDPLNLMTLPAQDKSLNLYSYSTTGFTAQWNGVQSAHTYHLQVFDLNGLPVADYQGPNLQYTVTGLTAGTEYTVSLVAINNTGQGKAQLIRTLTLPEQVGSILVSDIEEVQAQVQLSSVTGASFYKIELHDGTQFISSDVHYVMRQLKGSTAYTGTVQAGNNSGFGVPLSFNFTTKPARPSSLQVQTVGERELVLGWTADTTAERYWVTDEQGNRVEVTEPSLRISDLQPGTEYQFSVAAENVTGMGKPSEIMWSTKTEAPELLQVDADYTEASLTWTEPHGSMRYLLKDEANGHVYYNGSQAATQLIQLQVGHAYDLTLYSINKTGDASEGVQVHLVTKAELNEANAKITEVKSTSVTIELKTVGQAIQEYVILRDGQEITKVDAGSGEVIYKDTDLQPGTAYEYEIKPVNQGGEGQGIKLITTTATDPVSVKDLEVESWNDWVEIRFPEVDHAQEYVVIDEKGTELWRGDTLPIRIDGLEPGTSYPVHIIVENSDGVPSESILVELWTLPLAPSNITATSTTQTVTLDFIQVDTKGFTSLVIYRSGKEIGRVKAGQKHFSETGLDPATSYEYKIKALNPGGLSLEETTVSASTQSVPTITNPNPSSNTEETKEEENEIKPDDNVSPGNTNSDKDIFKDISTNFAKNEIESLAKDGIIKGISFEMFAPDKQITRMEFAALIVRTMSANPDESITLTFQDIKDSAWYARELNAAIVNGIAKGFSTLEFRPEALVNREQAAKMLINVLLSEGVAPGVTIQQFSDESDISVWAAEDVKMAMEQQLVKGYPDNTFRPKQGLTRAEAATLIYRLRELLLQKA
ncbi:MULTISPECIES: OmpL47-type beta-barrel domain-containing protein [Paenibacillus]|uniref:Fibronectin type III domain-containing protein n=1 Tax=Paenibacillus vandeheii TaxID=3035917 RepID=A0ABT8JFM7_9BACL|nr:MULTISPECIES: fibronectin type III domain-containing protein [Paenibacillus]MDN4603840.1 fibronectin type III domain-containing protein [Paenibacillus vandeheii]